MRRKMDRTWRAEGFKGQIFHVIPRPILDREASRFPVRELYATDIGWYPRADRHFRERPRGAAEHILIYCVEGQGWCDIAGARHAVPAGHALLIPRHTPHAYAAAERQPWSIHWVHFLGADADYYLRQMPEHTFVIPVSNAAGPHLAAVFAQCYAKLTAGYSSTGAIYVSHALRHLLGILFFDNADFAPGARPAEVRSFESLIADMQNRADGQMRLAELARQAGLSVPHFSVLFKRRTGMPPMSFFIHLKMQAACRLLDSSNRPCKEIAASLGYDDPYYFSRIFRRVMGMSPKTYRKTKKG